MNFRPVYRTPNQQMIDVSRDITGKLNTIRKKNLNVFISTIHFKTF